MRVLFQIFSLSTTVLHRLKPHRAGDFLKATEKLIQKEKVKFFL